MISDKLQARGCACLVHVKVWWLVQKAFRGQAIGISRASRMRSVVLAQGLGGFGAADLHFKVQRTRWGLRLQWELHQLSISHVELQPRKVAQWVWDFSCKNIELQAKVLSRFCKNTI